MINGTPIKRIFLPKGYLFKKNIESPVSLHQGSIHHTASPQTHQSQKVKTLKSKCLVRIEVRIEFCPLSFSKIDR